MRMYRCRNETDHVTKKLIKYVLFYFWNISLGLPLLGLRINNLSYFNFPPNLSITTFLVMARPCVSFKYSAENEWGFCGWAHSDGGMRADGDTCRRVTLRQCQFLHLCFLTCLNLRERQVIREGRVQPAELGECLSVYSSRAKRSSDGFEHSVQGYASES